MSGQLLQIAGLAASVFVGLIFLVAGIDKLRHRRLLPGVIANYRLLPAALVPPVAAALPVAELLIGAALLIGSRPQAPLAAIALLLVFAGAMAINIRRGRRHIDCGCGHAGLRQQLGWGMVLRNLGLAAALSLQLAAPVAMAAYDVGIAIAAGTTSFALMLMFNAVRALPGAARWREGIVPMMTALIISEILQWIVLAGLAVAGLALARQVGVLHVRVAPAGALDAGKGPAVGDLAPHLHATTLDGRSMTVGDVGATAKLRLLMFVSAQCPLCKGLIPVAKSFAAAERVELVFVGDDDPAAQRAMIAQYDMAAYPFINSTEVGRAFEVDKLPHAVLLGPGGKVLAKGLVNSREHLESLIVSHEMGVAHVQDYISGITAPVAKAEAA